ncbi:Mrp/NBP35 family ATP-binding protein [Amedibacillus dolichus]|uniref:Mrp/NBP35 family ATP-binding protein n=1 Tax=Amedibacillus dolichus TaxID=31971 RepID=UPI001EDB8A42|nr:Mrp/NBP35 family ATP-binding protein [Amedibacillus dolichus]MCG4879175.1 Mrp/NBP35 family ATP-binding protein [Amedibacillus dolichus]
MSDCNTCPSKGNCQKSEDACGITNNPKNKIKHVIGVMSGKGGVGKSSMTTLLAKELNKQGYRVGVMDADITGPSIPRLFGLEKEAAYGSNDAIQPVVDKDGIEVMSLNFLMEDEMQPVIWRGPIVGNAVKQFWTDVIWGELDFLLIDMPPGTGDVALTVMQSIPLNGVVMVSTPQPMVSMIVSKAINMCKQANVEVLGIIENMSYVQCPDCGKRIEIFAHKDVEHFLEVNGVELWAELPMMDSVSQIYKDDDFTSEYREQIRSSIAPAVEKLLAKFEK